MTIDLINRIEPPLLKVYRHLMACALCALALPTFAQTTLVVVNLAIQAQVAQGTMAGVTLSTALSNYQTGNAHQFNDDADHFLTVTGAGLLGTALGTQPDVYANGDN